MSLLETLSCLNIYSLITLRATYLKELIPVDNAVAVLVDLSQESLHLVIGHITLSEILQDSLELGCIHCTVLICVIQLESVLQFYKPLYSYLPYL
jgi:hypothetical protein